MAVLNQPGANLQAIINKIRLITRTPSTNQMSDQEIGDYINTFLMYDVPDNIQLFDYRTSFTWYCKPNVGTYRTDTSVIPTDDPLYDFQNLYTNIEPPIYVAGNQVWLSQSRNEFFAQWPFTNSIIKVGRGNGVATAFSGTLSQIPMLEGYVTVSSIEINNGAISLRDQSANPYDGTGVLIDTEVDVAVGTINYLTGAYSITFLTPPQSGADISFQIRPYTAGQPTSILYYDNQFTLRPVPDQAYAITMDVYKRPTALLDTASSYPLLKDYWQYIAWGAAKKIFEDRMDDENATKVANGPFKEQEILIMRKTINQLRNQRAASIYQSQVGLTGGPLWPNNGYYL